MIHRGAAAHELREQWRKGGGLLLREEGVLIALANKASLEEVLAVTHDEADAGRAEAKAVAAIAAAAVVAEGKQVLEAAARGEK